VLAGLVAELHRLDGSVAVPRFYEGARDIRDTDRLALAGIPFDEHEFFANTGAPSFGEPGHSTLERLWLRPCLDVNGMWGGYTAPGGKTVIPNEAHAKVTVRIVPGQDPDRVSKAVKDFLIDRCPDGCSVRFGEDRGQSAAYELPDNHPLLTTVEGALTDTFGNPPHRIRIGGTLPMADLVRRVLGIDTVMFSFSTADEDFHAPNEFFRLSSLDEGLRAWTALFRRLGEMSSAQFTEFRR
jgi:acetylornithine deacetylase/succinyl-diaminopimelate desuccinylase-like protein